MGLSKIRTITQFQSENHVLRFDDRTGNWIASMVFKGSLWDWWYCQV